MFNKGPATFFAISNILIIIRKQGLSEETYQKLRRVHLNSLEMTFELHVEHWVSLYILVGMYQTIEDKSKWTNGRWKQANAHSLSPKFPTLNHSYMKNENHYRKANCCTPDAAVFNSKAQKSHITQPATDRMVIYPCLSVNFESFFLLIWIFWCHEWNIGLWQTSVNSFFI